MEVGGACWAWMASAKSVGCGIGSQERRSRERTVAGASQGGVVAMAP